MLLLLKYTKWTEACDWGQQQFQHSSQLHSMLARATSALAPLQCRQPWSRTYAGIVTDGR